MPSKHQIELLVARGRHSGVPDDKAPRETSG
ncbi:Hypothetical Protein sle_24150 [Streptomyces leeuwenhoekii]|uniref:Uncharacterized protein n=1 Tax=Streptomyces leeuwenhoekii TaxID=1437453 RepID=A0A0F7VYI3_STRLW|nr:Hypothetical Protein sle_24150 [Streptomyces leeuwenhoekii]